MGCPALTIVVAMTQNRVIGRDGRLPWHIPGDLRLFKELTSGQTLIMGRQTFQSIGRPLPDRRHLVVSRSLPATPGVEVCRSFAEALRRAAAAGKAVYVIGGAEIYRQALPLASALVISWVRGDYTGDTYFPDFDLADWSVENVEEFPEFTRVRYKKESSAMSCRVNKEMSHD